VWFTSLGLNTTPVHWRAASTCGLAGKYNTLLNACGTPLAAASSCINRKGDNT